MYNISILTIGDEICIGQIHNTNSTWIASKCTETGADVIFHSSTGDNKIDIMSELDRLIPLSDLTIITGGLGPTHDDITKTVLTEYFDSELVFDESTYNHLEKFFALRAYKLTDRNKEQAILPSKSEILSNKIGTAPGMLFKKDNHKVISLPGVPAEMKVIMEDHVLPMIKQNILERNEKIRMFKVIQTAGIPESKLADLIGDPKEFLNGGSLAFLPSYKGVRLRIGVDAANFEKGEILINIIENIIDQRVGDFIIGIGDESLSFKIGKILSERKQTVAVAESCTAGMLGGELTSVSGSSNYFTGGVIVYSDEAKHKILGVNQNTLKKYGAVSEQTAIELAYNVKNKFSSDFGISITGIAGPTGGTDEKPVGTTWIGISNINKTYAKRFVFANDREINRERAVSTAMLLLFKELKNSGL